NSWLRGSAAPLEASEDPVVEQTQQICTVTALRERLGPLAQPCVIDPALPPGDLLGARDLQALTLLDRLDELRGFEQRFMGTGVQPCVATAQSLHVELAGREVGEVDVGDLELTARGGTDAARNVDDAG